MGRTALAGLLLPTLIFPSWATATKPAGKREPAKATAPAVAPSSAADAFLRRSTEPLTLASVLAQFDLFDRELKTLSARFTQSMTVQQTGMSSVVEGELAYAKPDSIVIRHLRPERQTVVADGKDVWIHRHAHNQVIQASLSDWKEADPMINNLMQVGSYSSMLRTYDVSLDTASSAPSLRLRPKGRAAAQGFELKLILASSNLFPEASELSLGDMRIKTRFAELRLNPPLEGSMFRFTPPEDADVFRDFKPPRFQQP